VHNGKEFRHDSRGTAVLRFQTTSIDLWMESKPKKFMKQFGFKKGEERWLELRPVLLTELVDASYYRTNPVIPVS